VKQGAVAKLSEAKRNEKFSFGGGGQRNSVGPFGFFPEKKIQLKKIVITSKNVFHAVLAFEIRAIRYFVGRKFEVEDAHAHTNSMHQALSLQE
jgi:hypothetical protein